MGTFFLFAHFSQDVRILRKHSFILTNSITLTEVVGYEMFNKAFGRNFYEDTVYENLSRSINNCRKGISTQIDRVEIYSKKIKRY
jgi:hypothetical protein